MALTEWLDTERPGWRTEDPATVAAWANTPVPVQRTREMVTVSECWAAVEPGEYLALSARSRAHLDRIFSGAEVPLGLGPVRARLGAMFGAGTQTRANLLALYDETIQETRAQAAGQSLRCPTTVAALQAGG